MSSFTPKSTLSEAKGTFGLTVVLAVVLVILVVGLFEGNIKAAAIAQTYSALEKSAANAEAAADMQVLQYTNALNFLHQTPPISGIVLATANGNVDPKDSTTLDQWKHRLETIFVAFIENNSEIDQLRVIQSNNEGSEVIRVEREGGAVIIASDIDLQTKASRNYFKESVKSNKGEFYISSINLNREYGKLEFPYKAVIRLSLPILSDANERYGFIIMNVNARFLLDQMKQALAQNQSLYVTDNEGYFTLHPDSDKSFSKDLNPSINWQSEFVQPLKAGRARLSPVEGENTLYSVSRAFTIGGGQQVAPFYLHVSTPKSYVTALINDKRMSVYSVLVAVTIIFTVALLFFYRSNRKNIELAKVRGESVAIVAISKDAIFSVDAFGKVKSWNMAAESLFGIPSQVIINQHFSSFKPLSPLGLETVLTKGGKQETFTTPYIDGEKNEHKLLITASTIWGDNSQFSGVAVVIRDVTDEHKAKDAIERVNFKLEEKVVSRTKELTKATEEARKASSVKSSFISNISHEMRTPLNGVVGSLSLLKRQPLNDKAEQLVSMMEISCNNLSVLINDVLDLSKIEAGKLDINHQLFEPLTLIESLAKVFAVKAATKGLELIVDTTGLPRVEISSDRHRLNQVLSNLLNNAIKFTEKGHIQLNAALYENDAGLQQLHFSVSDTGVGIAPESQPKLFTAFTQADASVATQYGGTGLGLSICKQLTQLLGGDITFKSEVGVGSTFSFYVTLTEKTPDTEASLERALEMESAMLSGINIGVSAGYSPLEENICSLAMHVGADAYVLDSNTDKIEWSTFNAVIVDESSPLINDLDNIWHAHTTEQEACALPVVFILQKIEGAPYQFNHIQPIYLPKPLFRSSFTLVQQGIDAALGGYSSSMNKLHPSDGNGPSDDAFETVKQTSDPQLSIEDANLLIVDDNLINREVAKGVLESLPGKMFTCCDGEEVIAFLQKCEKKGRRIHSILMDCQMPNMDGYETTRAIREGKAGPLHANVPIIAMTANAMLGEKEKCLEAGMDDFTTKPVIADVLIPKVKQWLIHQTMALKSEDAKRNNEIKSDPPALVDSLLNAINKEASCSGVQEEVSMDDRMSSHSDTNETDTSTSANESNALSDIPAPDNGKVRESWDKDDAIARIMGDKALFSRVCELYSQSAPDKLKQLKGAVEEQDFTQVQVLSLKLKGMSADIGAVQLKKDFELVWELSKGAQWEKVKALLPSIDDDLNTFIELLAVA